MEISAYHLFAVNGVEAGQRTSLCLATMLQSICEASRGVLHQLVTPAVPWNPTTGANSLFIGWKLWQEEEGSSGSSYVKRKAHVRLWLLEDAPIRTDMHLNYQTMKWFTATLFKSSHQHVLSLRTGNVIGTFFWSHLPSDPAYWAACTLPTWFCCVGGADTLLADVRQSLVARLGCKVLVRVKDSTVRLSNGGGGGWVSYLTSTNQHKDYKIWLWP